MKLPNSLKVSTSFFTRSISSSGTWAAYYISGIDGFGSSDTEYHNNLFIYRLRGDYASTEEVDVVENADYIGMACPEYFNLTNKVKVIGPAMPPEGESDCCWDELPKATYERISDDPANDGYKKITRVKIVPSACAASNGYFCSRVRCLWDLNAGIDALKQNTDEVLKALVDNYRDCRAVTTSMDTDSFPEGYSTHTTGSDTTSLRVRLQSKVTAESVSPTEIKYRLTVFVDKVINSDGVEVTAIPKNMFLCVKNNNTDGVLEKIAEGTYLRVIDPTDIQALNPNTFGYEKLVWGADDAVYSASDPVSCLSPALSSAGGPVIGLDALATSPASTHNYSGYYKSRVYCYVTRSASDTASRNYLINSAVAAFCTKYIAQGKNAIAYDSYEEEIIS